jgi:hypothetical protein
MKTFVLAATAAVAMALPPTGSNAIQTSKFEIRSYSDVYELGSYPYIAGDKDEVPIIKNSEAECQALCEAEPTCKYGTFVTEGSKMDSTTHSFDDTARFGECWLSSTTHATLTKCGVACASFKKVLRTAQPVTAPPNSDPVIQLGQNAAAIPVVQAADRKHHCKGADKKCAMSCHCNPFAHPSAFTKCRVNPFTQRVQVYHLTPKFHTRPFHPSSQHRCAHTTQGCSCCSCDTMVGVHSFVSVGIGRHIVDVREGNTGLIHDTPDKNFFTAQSTEECEKMCSEQSYDEEAAFIKIEDNKDHALEVTEGHSRLDCQARCDASAANTNGAVPCAAISIEGDTCALFPAETSTNLPFATTDTPSTGQVTLRRKADNERCIGGTYVGSGVNGGKCFLGSKLMSEADCALHPTKCLCDTAMSCTSFRRRPIQFHQYLDMFQGDTSIAHVALSSDCASIEGEICYNYNGCNLYAKDKTKQCSSPSNLPHWLWSSVDYIEGKNQCCGAGLTCFKDQGEARCVVPRTEV